MANTKVKVSNITRSNIQILGDNILYNNGIITAFYIIPLVNYSTNSNMGKNIAIQQLTNMISNLTTNNPEVMFTVERIEKIVKRKDVINNLMGTIQIYRPDYSMPIEFTKNVKDDRQDYCLLGVDIQQSTITDVEDYTITDTVKSLGKNALNALVGLGNTNIDPAQIIKIEEDIYRAVNSKCMRASKELVFYNFVSKLYPNYEISYDRLSYINENNFESIMSAVTQTVTDNFGWFELHNEGVEIFNCESMTTYATMLTIHSFPDKIDSANFPIDFPGNVVTTVKCLKKEDADIKIRRLRSSERYVQNQAIDAGAEDEDIIASQDIINTATMAIQDLEEGNVICNFNTSILVYAEDRETLKERVMSIITYGKDRNILIAKSLNQATDFLNYYVNKKPQKFSHLGPLMFPLCFQQNAGATVGDSEGLMNTSGHLIWSPSIGEDIV